MRTWIHPKPIHGSDWFTAFIDDFASGKLPGFILVERVNHLHFHLNCCEPHPLLAEAYSDWTSPDAPYFELFESGATGFLAKGARIGLELGDRTPITWRIIIVRWCKTTPLLQSSRTTMPPGGKVRTLLKIKTYGAHAMTYFGQFVIEVWEG